MELVERIFKAVAETLYCLVGNSNMSNEDFLIGLAAIFVPFLIWMLTYIILKKATKLQRVHRNLISISIAIGTVLIFIIICIIIDH